MTKEKKIIIALIILIILLIGAFVFYIYRNDPDRLEYDNNAKPIVGPVIEGSSGSINIVGFKRMTIPANQKNVPVSFVNPPSNDVDFRVKLFIDGKLIYTSGLFSPGYGIYDINIKPMKPGTYQATLHYETFVPNTTTQKNGAVVDFELVVE